MRVIRFSVVVLAVLCPSLLAQAQPNHEYPETGTVRFLVFTMGTFKNTQYVITTSHAIYRAQCTLFKSDQPQEPDCSFDHKTIEDGSRISFKIDGDTLVLPASDGEGEQRLLIDRTTMNPYP